MGVTFVGDPGDDEVTGYPKELDAPTPKEDDEEATPADDGAKGTDPLLDLNVANSEWWVVGAIVWWACRREAKWAATSLSEGLRVTRSVIVWIGAREKVFEEWLLVAATIEEVDDDNAEEEDDNEAGIEDVELGMCMEEMEDEAEASVEDPEVVKWWEFLLCTGGRNDGLELVTKEADVLIEIGDDTDCELLL